MQDKKLPFIILAGSPSERDSLMEYANVDYKSLIEVKGKTMISHIIDAVIDSHMASYLLISGIPEDLVQIPDTFDKSLVEFLPLKGEQVDNVVNTATHLFQRGNEDPRIFLSGTPHAVILTSDVPALTSGIIKRHLQNCGDRSASFYYAVVHQSKMDARFPNNGRSWIKVDRENYCGGDVMLVDVTVAKPSYPILKKILENRKNFVKALFWASPITFFKFIFKRVGMKDVERLMTKIFGFESRLIISEDAEVAFDVDKPFQLDIIREHIVPGDTTAIS
jgi:hypothetical protein